MKIQFPRRRLRRGRTSRVRNTALTAALLDDMLATYVQWRERAAHARDAYRRWSDGPTAGADARFARYMAALDQEESAAAEYAQTVCEVGQWLEATARSR